MFKSPSLGVSQEDVVQLYGMLQTKRPAGSVTEARFIGHFLRPLGLETDGYGNLYKRIGDLPVAWSSHVDTVHSAPGVQDLVIKDKRIIKLRKDETSNCLGADDTAGVWLMVQMIKAQRPGLYIFHREEERGGKGSRWAAANNAKLVEGIQCMIALDRRGCDSVITRQSGGRCCSDDFGNSLAEKLNREISGLFKYKLDTGGSFTDSASYTDIVAECTNLSVGYFSQHWKDESLDLNHLLLLRRALLDLDFRDLTIKRKPGEKEAWRSAYYPGEDGWGGSYGCYNHNRYDDSRGAGYYESGKWVSTEKTKALPKPNNTNGSPKKVYEEVHYRLVNGKKVVDTLLALTQDYPLQVADMLHDWGITVAMLRDEIKERLGPKREVRGGSQFQQVNKHGSGSGKEGSPL